MINKKLIENDIKSEIENHHVSGQYVFKSDNIYAIMFKYNQIIYILEYVYDNDDNDNETSNLYLYDCFDESVCGPEYIDDDQLNFVEILFIKDIRVIIERKCFFNVDIESLINLNDVHETAMLIYFNYLTIDPECYNYDDLPNLNKK